MLTPSDFFGLVGLVSLYGGTLCCILSIAAAIFFLFKQHPKIWSLLHHCLRVQVFLIGLSVLSLAILLQIDAFEYTLVFDSVEIGMPWYQKLGGLWSAQASSLLFFSFIFSIVILLTFRFGNRLTDWRIGVFGVLILNITLVFFLMPPAFWVNPFEKFWLLEDGSINNLLFATPGAVLVVPTDGRGLTPSLRHLAMLLHPPFLYIGMIGFFIPYALALGTLVYKLKDKKWVRVTYPVAIFSWICLTLGMFLGSWWAYSIQGWGGYWGWDAVEISGLLPWLLSFALLHSMQAQMRKRPFYRWVLVFTFLIFIFVLLGILITRSGILDSVHAYTSGKMGPILTGLLLSHLVFILALLIKRWKLVSPKVQGLLQSNIDQLVIGLNDCILILVLIYLFGQTLPITSPFLLGGKMEFGEAEYEYLSIPFLLLILLFTALFPRIQKSGKQIPKGYWVGLLLVSAAVPLYLFFRFPISLAAIFGYSLTVYLFGSWFYLLVLETIQRFKGQRRSKGFLKIGIILVHLGLALLAFGILGVENFTIRYEIGLQAGDELNMEGWTASLAQSGPVDADDGFTIVNAPLYLEDQHGREVQLIARIESYPKLDLTNAVPAIHSDVAKDINVILTGWRDGGGQTREFQITILPCMLWIWIGAIVMLAGGILLLAASLKYLVVYSDSSS